MGRAGGILHMHLMWLCNKRSPFGSQYLQGSSPFLAYVHPLHTGHTKNGFTHFTHLGIEPERRSYTLTTRPHHRPQYDFA